MSVHTISKQDYYDLLCKSAIDGTFPSYEHSICRYRSKNGNRCAIGVLVSEDEYSSGSNDVTEGLSPVEFLDRFEKRIEGFSPMDYFNVRNCHDALYAVWHPETFLNSINALGVFSDVVKKTRIALIPGIEATKWGRLVEGSKPN